MFNVASGELEVWHKICKTECQIDNGYKCIYNIVGDLWEIKRALV